MAPLGMFDLTCTHLKRAVSTILNTSETVKRDTKGPRNKESQTNSTQREKRGVFVHFFKT